MLTTATTPVDAAPRAVMWSIKQIAERDGVSKQATSKAVARLVEQHGLTVERDGKGRISAVNVAEYDHLRGRFADPSKDQRPKPLPGAEPKSADSLDEARRRNAWIENERARIALAETKKELIRAAGVLEAAAHIGVDIARILDRLVNCTDDLANAVAREGVHGLRVALKAQAGRMRNEVADALAKIASEAPEQQEEPASSRMGGSPEADAVRGKGEDEPLRVPDPAGAGV